jgi:hypothetical protein
MVQELLSRVSAKTGHIAILLLLSLNGTLAQAQSVLLPGDIVVVTVNASDNSFDFIPLVDIEKGTSVWFKNGRWNADDFKVEGGQEISLTFSEAVDAGTNIHLNGNEDSRFERSGSLEFTGDGDRIFVLQEDEGIGRVIFGIGWGSDEVWNEESVRGSEIPKSISAEQRSLLTLGNSDNYQYYLRNGASGTARMLADFVTDPSKWRDGENEFSTFGTTFRLLEPPVVLFDESVSSTQEGNSVILNVAIFEHDGSKLTVEAQFNERYSTADTNDVSGFKSYEFNFTGLIGDAVYAIEVPVEDDDQYQGSRNAFFELVNLSQGNYGDFVSHVAFLHDNEVPDVSISGLSLNKNPSTDFIEIRNNEQIPVDLNNWKLRSRGFVFEFGYRTVIDPLGSIRIVHPEAREKNRDQELWPGRASGKVELLNPVEQVVSAMDYRSLFAGEQTQLGETSGREMLSTSETRVASGSSILANAIEEQEKKRELRSGWYVTNAPDPVKQSFYWDEKELGFRNHEEMTDESTSSKIYLNYRTDEELEADSVDIDTTFIADEAQINPEMRITLSGTDRDENGIINGDEGFNLLANLTGQPVSVGHFYQQLEQQIGQGAVYPYIYAFDHGRVDWEHARILKMEDYIPANSAFWIRADSVFEAISIDYQFPQAPVIQNPEVQPEREGTLSLRIQMEDDFDDIRFNLFDMDDIVPRDIIKPGLEPVLIRVNKDYLVMGAQNSGNWNSVINLNKAEDQRFVFPLAFSASQTGTMRLSVTDWEQIPLDWQIIIEDRGTGKQYDLNQDWELEFDYFEEMIEDDVVHALSESLDQEFAIDERFQLILLPPGIEYVDKTVPEDISLGQNYPNPFNPRTTIAFFLPESMRVKLSVFNVVGQPVAVLEDGVLGVGDHEYEWDASGLPSGMYIYQLEVGNKVMTRKMTLVK